MSARAAMDGVENNTVRDVVGNKADTVAQVINSVLSLVAYVKGIFARLMALDAGALPGQGKVWYVDSANGSATGNGKSWSTAFNTIALGYAAANAGDTILMRGSFTEAVVCAKAGLKFVGVGTNPKECQWTGATDATCLTISANYVQVKNIYFRPPARSSGTPAAIKISAAQWTQIRGCRFQGRTGSYYAIYSATCDSDNTHIVDNEFFYMNTLTYGAAILGVEAGGMAYSGWVIENNIFHSCVTAININGRCCIVRNNIFMEYGNKADSTLGAVMTLGIDLSGSASGGCNSVYQNQLGGTYDATLYKVGAGGGDQWAGNFNSLSGGVTAANPA